MREYTGLLEPSASLPAGLLVDPAKRRGAMIDLDGGATKTP